MSEAMSEKFFLGAIQGLIGAIIVYFWLRHSKKKEEKQYEKALKEEIYHDSSPQATASSNTVEVDYYNTLYDELKEKCNPAIYMNPYNAEKVEISNQIYSQLDSNKDNVSYLIELRNLAIKKLGLSFSAKELFEKLSEIYNPNNYMGEKYDADKLHVANQVYAKIQRFSNDIVELEHIAKETNIVLIKKNNTDVKPNLVLNEEKGPRSNKSKEEDNYRQILVICLLVVLVFIPLTISMCSHQHNDSSPGIISNNSDDLLADSVEECIDSVVAYDNISNLEMSTNTYTNGLYSIQYPENWVVTENINEYTDVHIGSTTSNIGFTILHFYSDQSLDDVQNTSDNNMIEGGFDIVKEQELKISGIKAYERMYFIINKEEDVTSDNYNLTFLSYLIKKDDTIFSIKFGNCFKDEHEKIAREIIQSFEFKNL